MGRANTSTLLNTMSFLLLMSLWSVHNVDAAISPSLTFCVIRRNPPLPNTTVTAIFPPGFVPSTTAPQVGTPVVTVADNVLRETIAGGCSDQSPEIGRQRVIRVGGFTKDDQFITQATGVLDFRTKRLNGTISFSGIQTTGANIPPVEELAITGGTGMYRSANGHAKVFLVRNAGGLVIIKWEVYLCLKDPLCAAVSLLD